MGNAGVIVRCRAGLASRSRADGGLRRIGARLADCRQQRVGDDRGVESTIRESALNMLKAYAEASAAADELEKANPATR